MKIECGEIIKSDKSSLTFKPNATSIKLYYPDNLYIDSEFHIDFRRLFLISLLSIFVFYLLFKYILYFKKSKNDLIFLLIFVLTLFIPILHFDNSFASNNENRKLAELPHILNNINQINLNFFNEFNQWFNDRFFLRQKMCYINSQIKYAITSNFYVGERVFLNKKNNYIFEYKNIHNFRTKDKNLFKKNLVMFDELCKKNNIKLYILITPIKESVLEELIPINNNINFSFISKFYNDIKKETNLKIIYPYEKLKEASKKDFVFYKCDHHWTDYGTYIAYKELVKEIKKDFPDFMESNINDFNIIEHNYIRSTISRTFGIPGGIRLLNINSSPILDTKYKYLNHKDYKNIKIINNFNYGSRSFLYKNSKNKLKAVIVGNSMSVMLSYIMSHDFLSLTLTQGNGGKQNSKININGLNEECIKPKPDIIILNISSTYVRPIANMYNN